MLTVEQTRIAHTLAELLNSPVAGAPRGEIVFLNEHIGSSLVCDAVAVHPALTASAADIAAWSQVVDDEDGAANVRCIAAMQAESADAATALLLREDAHSGHGLTEVLFDVLFDVQEPWQDVVAPVKKNTARSYLGIAL